MEFLIFLALQQVLDGIAANSKAVAASFVKSKVDGRVKDFTVHAVVEICALSKNSSRLRFGAASRIVSARGAAQPGFDFLP